MTCAALLAVLLLVLQGCGEEAKTASGATDAAAGESAKEEPDDSPRVQHMALHVGMPTESDKVAVADVARKPADLRDARGHVRQRAQEAGDEEGGDSAEASQGQSAGEPSVPEADGRVMDGEPARERQLDEMEETDEKEEDADAKEEEIDEEEPVVARYGDGGGAEAHVAKRGYIALCVCVCILVPWMPRRHRSYCTQVIPDARRRRPPPTMR